MAARLDFDEIGRAALAQAEQLVPSWFPAGKRSGHEWVVGDIQGNPGSSLSINLRTGKFADFAGDVKGGDLISLYAAMRGCNQGEAARELADQLGIMAPAAVPPRKDKSPPKEWRPVLPVPANAPPPIDNHYAHGKPAARWAYHDAAGEVLGYVCRFDMADGGKEVIPLCYCESEGKREWKWKSFIIPRPLYGLDRLAARPKANVVIVEGEKAADAAYSLFPQAVVITWPGGCKAVKHADWTPLKGRKIVVWPDADEPGMKAALAIAELLAGIAAGVRVAMPPVDSPHGWDAADAFKEGWDAARAAEWLKAALREPAAAKAAIERKPPADEPPPHDGPDYHDMPDVEGGGENDPYLCLGHDHGRYFYMTRGSKQVIELTGPGHTKGALLMLASLNHWEREYPGSKGANWDMAANALIRRCEAAGVYDPSRARGRGVWWDDGRAVVHVGDQLVIDGSPQPLHNVASRFVYEAAPPIRISLGDPLPSKESVQLVNLCRMLPWEKPIDGLLLAGWCALAPICGALAWRPHIWVTGGAGTGKSWLLENVVARVLGDMVLAVQSETTEAGLRQVLGTDALPVIFDEAEAENQRAQARIQNVMALMRQASSESAAAILKGSAGGEGQTYRIRSMFAFASIGVGTKQHADATRVSVLSLRVNPDTSKEERMAHFARIQEERMRVLTPELIERLQARIIGLIPIIRKNAETFAIAGAKAIGTRRLGDQIGALLAGAYALHSNKLITPEEATAWVEKQDWSEESQVQEERDELACLQHIVEHQLRAQSRGNVTVDRSIGELIGYVINNAEEGVSSDFAEMALKRIGIKVNNLDGMVVISNTHTGLGRILADTPWARNWGRILKRINGSVAAGPMRFGSGPHQRAVSIPLEIALGE